ncbi:hypothetical protein H6P81_014621 [Aristolochia fimbriata]|uniref:Uncharacterized protein n=1 Tax=Aristolochia fimbriata TaxID=158543 RepID=A0AAV7E644_ARIFI|nr:hypothetical protein H6P81_014621 [Aristolochia fimbriata]
MYLLPSPSPFSYLPPVHNLKPLTLCISFGFHLKLAVRGTSFHGISLFGWESSHLPFGGLRRIFFSCERGYVLVPNKEWDHLLNLPAVSSSNRLVNEEDNFKAISFLVVGQSYQSQKLEMACRKSGRHGPGCETHVEID